MGSGASTGGNEVSSPGQMKRSKPRSSIAVQDLGITKEMMETNAVQITDMVYQIKVPPGALPGSTFSAICGTR